MRPLRSISSVLSLSASVALIVGQGPQMALSFAVRPIRGHSHPKRLRLAAPQPQIPPRNMHYTPPISHEQKDTLRAFGDKGDAPSVEETTEKYGLEAGLFQSLKSDNKGQSAKGLLKKYGVAYLATSIPLAAVSFAICYALVDGGVDVAALLQKVGISVGETGETAGTGAIAYAAHKAASPIRFPPTVALTPVVAKLIGKEPNEDGQDEDEVKE